jgi:hypothetical protein
LLPLLPVAAAVAPPPPPLLSLLRSYACLPSGASGGGVEFVLSARASVPQDTTLVGAQSQLHTAVAAIVSAIATGQIV